MAPLKDSGWLLNALAAAIPGVEKAMILFHNENKKAQEISDKACAFTAASGLLPVP